jgi:hypothetical protein
MATDENNKPRSVEGLGAKLFAVIFPYCIFGLFFWLGWKILLDGLGFWPHEEVTFYQVWQVIMDEKPNDWSSWRFALGGNDWVEIIFGCLLLIGNGCWIVVVSIRALQALRGKYEWKNISKDSE